MPVNRQACERCRGRKTRCTWLEDGSRCVRCTQNGAVCVLPPPVEDALRHSFGSRGNASSNQNHLHTLNDGTKVKELEARIARLDRLLGHVDGTPESSDLVATFRSSDRLNKDINNLRSSRTVLTETSSSNNVSVPDLWPGKEISRKRKCILSDTEDPLATAIIPGSVTSRPAREQPAHKPFGLDSPRDFQLTACPSGSCYLPPVHEASALLNEFLHDFNSKIPLFSPDSIYSHMKLCYSKPVETDPLPYVLTYVALAIAHRMHAMGLFATPEDSTNSEYYMNKSLTALPDLLMRKPSLQLAQAALGVSILLQTSRRTQRAPVFVAAAMHMVQRLGYHDLPAVLDQRLDMSSNEQRYVFWIAYMMDTNMSLSAMRPTALRRADINTPLPSVNAEDWWSTTTSETVGRSWRFNVFALHSSLAWIQAEALEELFSASARYLSPDVKASIHQKITDDLEAWRQSNVLSNLEAQEVSRALYRSDTVHCVMLDAAYFRLSYQLHSAAAAHFGQKPLGILSSDALHRMASAGFPGCYEDAWRLLSVAALVPQDDVSHTWATSDALMPALCAVLVHLHTARDDSHKVERLRLCERILGALQVVCKEDADLLPALRACQQQFQWTIEGDDATMAVK